MSYDRLRHGREHRADVEEERLMWKDERSASLVGVSAAKPDLRMHTDTHHTHHTHNEKIFRVKLHINHGNQSTGNT